MIKKLFAALVMSALVAMCLAGCGAKSEEPSEPAATEPTAAEKAAAPSIVIGDVEACPQFVYLLNGTDVDITNVMCKPSSDEAYDGPLGQEGAWEAGAVAEVHYYAIEAEPFYDLRFEFADGSDMVAEGVAMFDVINATVTPHGLEIA